MTAYADPPTPSPATAAVNTALCATSFMALAFCGPTHAQPAALAPEAPATVLASASATLQSVVVKGKRENGELRSSNATAGVLGDLALIDTPFSINVITRRLLDNQQAASYGDFLKNDPSATFGAVPVGFASLRGFAVGTDGYLFDGLVGSVAVSDGRWQLEGVERIEILKGPSAFLYGLGASSSLGGTINFVPKRPTDQPVRDFGVGYTSKSLLSVSADLGDRFGADRQFGYRLNLGFKDGQQAVDRYDWNHQAAILALDWRVTPNLLLTAGYEYAKNGFPSLQPFLILDPALTEVPEPPAPGRSFAQPWDDFKTIGSNAYLRADWTLGSDWSVTAQLLHSSNLRPRVKSARFGQLSDAAGSVSLFGIEDENKVTADSGQVLLHGKADTAGIEHRLTLGLTATRSKTRYGSASLGVFPTNLYAPVDAPEPADAVVEMVPTQNTRTASVLLSDIVKLGDRWSALLGVRSAKLEVDNLDGNPITTSKTSPTAALMFKPTTDSLAYLTYAEGLEQGGKAPVGTTNQDKQLAPIKTRQFELGAKLETDGLTLAVALFDMRKPFEYVEPTTLTYVQNGLQQHRGFEFTATGRATPDLTVVAGMMVLDAKASNTGDAGTEGKRPVGVPRLTANLYGEHRIAAVPGLYLNGGVYYSAQQYLDASNRQAVPGWTRLDIGARYETRIADRRTSFLFGVENLANRGYWAGAQSGILTVAEPRTVKVSANFSY